MPKTCPVEPAFHALVDFQDHVAHRDQALTRGLSAESIRYRLRTHKWARLLPEVYLTHPGEASRRQQMIAALLFAGPDSAIDGFDACRFHGIRSVASDLDQVHVVVPHGSAARSRGFVTVRRTATPITVVATDRIRYVDAATAVIAATRCMVGGRSVLAALSDALQGQITTYEALVEAHRLGPRRNSRLATVALESLGAGTRSVPEAEFRELVASSAVLSHVRYNVWLRLPSGRRVCVDALIESSGVVHETNGRLAHAREDLFEDMQERHDELTASGFTVLHNPPSRIRLRGREVLAQLERCHRRNEGRGLPPGVCILATAV